MSTMRTETAFIRNKEKNASGILRPMKPFTTIAILQKVAKQKLDGNPSSASFLHTD